MKKRLGFVSNSSSSSFIISKKNLNDEQIYAIKNHKNTINEFKDDVGYECDEYDAYELTETSYCIKGETTMDNYPIDKLFNRLNINCSDYRFGEYIHELDDFESLIMAT